MDLKHVTAATALVHTVHLEWVTDFRTSILLKQNLYIDNNGLIIIWLEFTIILQHDDTNYTVHAYYLSQFTAHTSKIKILYM
jgi:hypothetical protein